MKRHALIIGSPGKVGTEDYLRGVLVDTENYKNYLMSPIGGAWYKDEVKTLIDPTSTQVSHAIQAAQQADYAFIVFSGHGAYSNSKGATILQINSNETITSLELTRGFKKLSVVLDCCRKEVLMQVLEKRAFTVDAAAKQFNEADCRRYFDKNINDCAESFILINACSINEYAYDDSNRGGYYSFSLLNQAQNWANRLSIDTSKNYQIESIASMHEKAAEKVRILSSEKQNPTIQKPREGKYFPFCIVA